MLPRFTKQNVLRMSFAGQKALVSIFKHEIAVSKVFLEVKHAKTFCFTKESA